MKIKFYILCIVAVKLMLVLAACNSNQKSENTEEEDLQNEVAEQSINSEFYLEGHRGARGLMPENTIPSMIKAVADGANVLELDIHISKDNKVIVAHDPYINGKFSIIPEDHGFKTNDKDRIILYTLDYEDIKTFDVGSKPYETFPLQKKIKTHIPLLSELIDSVETFTNKNNLDAVIYNVEVKSNPKMDGINHPAPKELIDLTMKVLNEKNLDGRFYIQSFDIRQIQAVKENYPNVTVGYLTSDNSKSFKDTVEMIGFQPEIFSPHFKMATKELIEETQKSGSKFIPWTVNQEEDMAAMLDLNVDGIITDFPGRLRNLMINK